MNLDQKFAALVQYVQRDMQNMAAKIAALEAQIAQLRQGGQMHGVMVNPNQALTSERTPRAQQINPETGMPVSITPLREDAEAILFSADDEYGG